MSLIFVDCEGHGPAPMFNDETKFEFGAVEYDTELTFHGKGAIFETFADFHNWLKQFKGRPIFVSDNPAYDWQFINFYFIKFMRENPFGHSARRIGDFYAGLNKDFRKTQGWKTYRVTVHDHNPVHDAQGNVEAVKHIMKLYNAK